jgi:hypothetical protein
MTPEETDAVDAKLQERYRQASSAQGLGPTEAVRAAILAEGKRIAQQRAKAPVSAFDTTQPAANQARWKIAAFGTFGVAILGALLMIPQLLPTAPPAGAVTPPPVETRAAAQPKRESSAVANRYQEPSAKANSAQLAELARPAPAEAGKLTNSIEAAQSDSAAAAGASVSAPRAAAARTAAPAAAPPPVSGAAAPADLQSAVAAGDEGRAAILLDQHAAIEERDGLGRTPLMLATMRGQIGMVRLLLAHGADPNAADNTGNTPLKQAHRSQFAEIAGLLENAGAR